MMNDTLSSNDTFRNRVITAAEAALKAGGSVGPIELFERMGFLHQCHIEGWRKGNEFYRFLEPSIRVGRSAAGRALDPRAIELAVIAHIRHVHTNYDELLMQGTDRLDARTLVRSQISDLLDRWITR